ncbi:MAG: choice-of-anchor L domain-containing protein [Desmonostoc vinosum HA7617-LM4]|jgi:Ca2+-binding RTX toxin-like protein|nr:choice-of-anchor L domain-containing protein [Desmonostoc vinosum HA7617-LM4]
MNKHKSSHQKSSVSSNFADLDISLKLLVNDVSDSVLIPLTNLTANAKFSQTITTSFGNDFNVSKLETLRNQWAARDFSQLPTFEIRSTQDLGGARGAFSQTNNTIYISAEFFSENASNYGSIKNILLEEIGHFIDAQINQVDSPGDEGEIFANLVQGRTLTQEQLQQLKTENDAITITVDAQTLPAEAATTATDNLGLLAGKITNSTNTGLLDKIKLTLDSLIPDTSQLPLIDKKLDLKGEIDKFIDGLRTQIAEALNKGQNDAVGKIQTGLFNALSGAGILLDSTGDNQILLNDIVVVNDPKNITFDFKLGKNFDPNITFDEKLGLPKLGLNLLGLNLTGGISSDLKFELSVGFGVDDSTDPQNAVFLKTLPSANEFKANLGVRLKDKTGKPIKFSGNLGYLNLTAEDTTPGNTNNLNANFEFNVKGGDPTDGRIRFSNLSNLGIDPTPLTADANLSLHLDTGVGSQPPPDDPNDPTPPINADFPSVEADFKLTNLTFNSKNPATPKPNVAFNDVNLDFGSFISNFGKTVFGKVKTITGPLEPIINTLEKKLPVIDASLVNIAQFAAESNLFGSTIGPGTIKFIDTVTKVGDLVNKFPTGAGNIKLALGSFDLSKNDVRDANGELTPNTTDTKNPLDQLATAGNGNNTINEFITALVALFDNQEPSTSDNTKALIAEIAQDLNSDDLKKFIPILADPTSVFNVLLGKQVELFAYNTPVLEFRTGYAQSIPIFGPISLRIGGSVGASAQVRVGYDTQGLIEFQENGDATSLLDGFFAGRPLGDIDKNGAGDGVRDHNLELSGEITAEAAIDVQFASAAVGGGIGLTVGFDLGNDDANPSNQFDPQNYKIRGSDIIENIDSPFCLFSPSGELAAIIFGQVTLNLGFFNFSKRLDLANIKLVSFTADDFGGDPCAGEQSDHYNVEDPEPPKEDSPLGQELLAQGIIDRKATGNKDIITIEHLSGDQKGDPTNKVNTSTEKIKIIGLDPAPGKEYQKVKLIILSLGEGDDTFSSIGGVQAPIQIKGGKGNDTITTGDGNDFLNGGAGNDILNGGGSKDNTADYSDSPNGIVVNLSASVATNDGFGNQDLLQNIQNVVGSKFGDTITGTNEKNVFQGGKGNDTLKGLGGDDVLLGELGADDIDGGEGKDTITYIGSLAPVYVNLSTSSVPFISPIDKTTVGLPPTNRGVGGEAAGDKLTSIENLQGSVHNDILAASDIGGNVSGLGGDDILIAGPKDDIFNGDSGNDWVSYQRSNAGVEVHLVLPDGNAGGGFAAGDKLLSLRNQENVATQRNSIENLEGSKFQDVLEGDIGNNILRGLAGNDLLFGNEGNDTLIGGADADVLDGGGSIDLADYSESLQGVTVKLLGVGAGGDAKGDTFAKLDSTHATVENLLGSDFADNLTGDGGNNEINPGLSNFGTDVVDGGDGNDRLVIDYSINDKNGTGVIGGFSNFANPTNSFSRGSGTNPPIQDAVSFKNIERLKVTATSKADQIFGGADDDVILGGDGNDTIAGGRGNNLILGDDGNDFIKDQNDASLGFSGTPGNSFIILSGGAGVDTLSIDLSGKSEDITLISLNPLQESINQQLILSDGSVITLFEAFRDIKTGVGKDQLTQLGRVDNNFTTGGGNDTINIGLGIDIVDGGSSTGDDDLLVIDYSVGDVGSGILSFFNGTNGGEIHRNVTNSTTALDKVNFSNIERLNVTGTSKADQLAGGNGTDILIGNNGDDVIIGNKGNDSLSGGANNDFLIGVRLGPSPASGNEIDTLTGGTGKDEFWLGDEREIYYDDENLVTSGLNNQGQITDFNPGEGDIIQLHGKSSDYIVKEIRTGTQIFLRDLNTVDELIGFVQEFTKFDLNASYVRYVDSTPDSVSTSSITSLNAVPVPTNPVQPTTDNTTATTPQQIPTVADTLLPVFEIKQNGNGFDLLNLLRGITNNHIFEFDVKLTGDPRAFGTFQNDPFGLGAGVVLSTGKVKDLAGVNTADGGFAPGNGGSPGGASIPLQFQKLAGSTSTGTGVFRADLSSIGVDLNSLTIADNGSGKGGAGGKFSGFDLDAIKLSRTLVTSAADIAALPGLDVFNFSPIGTILTPGTQRPSTVPPFDPVAADLNGTLNGIVNNAIATLGKFDSNSTATKSATLGDGGEIRFDLTSPVSTDSPLYLYVGDAGNDDGTPLGNVNASNQPTGGQNDLSTDFGTPGAADDTTSMEISFFADETAPTAFFQFVVSSEEFVEYGGSQLNDAFSFKLNGLDLAQLNDGSAVTINNLTPTPFSSNSDFIYNPAGTGPAANQTKLDGYSKVLTFAGPTIPNVKNTLVVSVKDVRDGSLDSAIFLKGATLGTVDPNNLPGSVDVTVGDKDSVIAEGGIGTSATIALKTIPKDNVIITIDPDKQLDAGNGGDKPLTLTFTPGNALTPVVVPIKAVDDTIFEGNHKGKLSFTINSNDPAYKSLSIPDSTIDIIDNDSLILRGSIKITPKINGLAATEGGAKGGFAIALDTVPTDTVTITIDPDKLTGVGQGPDKPLTLTFTPENALTPQLVDITGVDNQIVDGDHTGTITFKVNSNDPAYNGLSIPDQKIAIKDNDVFNKITGTPGRNTLVGTNDPDQLIGDQGKDILTGGGGGDQFIYTKIRDAGDIITDFTIGEDQIVLTQLLSSLKLGAANIGFRDTVNGTQITLSTIDGVFRPFILVQGNDVNATTLNNPSNLVF